MAFATSVKERLKRRKEREKIRKEAYRKRKEELEKEKRLTRAEKEAELKKIAERRGIKGADWRKRLKESVGSALYKRLSVAWEIREFEKEAYKARKGEVDARRREAKIQAAKRRGVRKAERGPVGKAVARSAVGGGKAALKGGKKAFTAWEKWYYRDVTKRSTPKKTTAKKRSSKDTYRKFNGERFKRVALKRLKSEAVAKRKSLSSKGYKARIIKVNGMWEVYSRKS